MHPILRSLCLPLSESQRLARLHYRALALRAMLVATPFALSAWLHLASHYQILLLPPHWLESGRLFLPSLDRTMRFWEYMADYQHAPALRLVAASSGEMVLLGWATYLFGVFPLSVWWLIRSRRLQQPWQAAATLSARPVLRRLMLMIALLFIAHSFAWHIAFTGLLDYVEKPYYPLIPGLALGFFSVTLWVAVSHYRHVSNRLQAFPPLGPPR